MGVFKVTKLRLQFNYRIDRGEMPRNLASKVFNLFPHNARWEIEDPLPAHQSSVVWLFWVVDRTVVSAVSAVWYSYYSFSIIILRCT